MYFEDETRPRYLWGPPGRARSGPARPSNANRLPPGIGAYDAPAPGKAGHSYRDPIYDQIEAPLELELGLPNGLLRAIRTRGEKSNADDISPRPDYAQTVYQITPSTRELFRDGYKVDAYEGLKQAARVAALHLLDSYRRRRDWNWAIAEYQGGTNIRNWRCENAEYRRNVGDFMNGSSRAPAATCPSPRSSRGR